MSASPQADSAQARLVAAARDFARFTPRRNPSGAYARALTDLLGCRDDFARKTDEEWAAEVTELRGVILELGDALQSLADETEGRGLLATNARAALCNPIVQAVLEEEKNAWR